MTMKYVRFDERFGQKVGDAASPPLCGASPGARAGLRPDGPLPLSQEAREAIIEHNRVMKEQRAFVAANRERIDAEWEELTNPRKTLAGYIAEVRMRLGEARWNELQREWE